MVLDASTLGRNRQTYEETGIGGQTWQTGPMSNWTANGHELGQTAAPQDARGATPISLYNYFVYSRSTAPGGCMLPQTQGTTYYFYLFTNVLPSALSI